MMVVEVKINRRETWTTVAQMMSKVTRQVETTVKKRRLKSRSQSRARRLRRRRQPRWRPRRC